MFHGWRLPHRGRTVIFKARIRPWKAKVRAFSGSRGGLARRLWVPGGLPVGSWRAACGLLARRMWAPATLPVGSWHAACGAAPLGRVAVGKGRSVAVAQPQWIAVVHAQWAVVAQPHQWVAVAQPHWVAVAQPHRFVVAEPKLVAAACTQGRRPCLFPGASLWPSPTGSYCPSLSVQLLDLFAAIHALQ